MIKQSFANGFQIFVESRQARVLARSRPGLSTENLGCPSSSACVGTLSLSVANMLLDISVAECCVAVAPDDVLPSSFAATAPELESLGLAAARSLSRASPDEAWLSVRLQNDSVDDDSILDMAPAIKKSRPTLVDPYQVLQVRRDATPSEIRHAYRRLALWHHPGRCLKTPREERARRRHVFEVLAACYETLLDKDARVRVDALLKERPVQAQHVVLSKNRPRETLPDLVPSLSRLSSNSESDSDSVDGLHHPRRRSESSPTPATAGTGCKNSSQQPSQASSHHRKLSVGSHPSVSAQPQVRKVVDQPLSLLSCGGPSSVEEPATLPSLIRSSSSASQTNIHFSEHETNRLFGGPLQLLFRARRWQPFTDPFAIFADVFGPVDLGPIPDADAEWKPLPHRPSAWSGSSEKLRDGTVIFTTTRTLHDRVLVREETIRGHDRHSKVTVTSEELPTLEAVPSSDESACNQFDACAYFQAHVRGDDDDDDDDEDSLPMCLNPCTRRTEDEWAPFCHVSWLSI